MRFSMDFEHVLKPRFVGLCCMPLGVIAPEAELFVAATS
jgi:hypothetical protein